jgi:hypothetical protein
MTRSRINPDGGFYWDQTEDRADMCGPGLLVAFARTGMVWTHSLVLPGEEGHELARAVETDPERDDPRRVVSPVYQEIHRHQSALGPGLCVLLTGTLHKHHFSAAINLGRDPDWPYGMMLDVDVADRCRSPVENLSATYTVALDSGKLARAGPEAITWDNVGAGEGGLEIEPVAPSTLVLAEAGRSATRVQVIAAIQPAGFTHRLHYRWRWTSRAGLTR